ncbi:MAG: hypothetical protein HC896_04305 [Bacteroidales bacterium]|nr:hypothetical protein [Bacteroidales bacterium]
MKKLWHKISYLGISHKNNDPEARNTMVANRLNFAFVAVLLLLNILTTIIRETSDGPYTIHTKKLLALLIIGLANFYFSHKHLHQVTKFNLVYPPVFIGYLLPILFGHVQEFDFIVSPLIILTLSFVPQLTLAPKLSNKPYVISLSFFFVLMVSIDNLLTYFGTQAYYIPGNIENFWAYYKTSCMAVFIMTHSTIFTCAT